MMIVLARVFRTTLQNISRHLLTSFVAVLIITLLFVLFNGIIFAKLFQSSALDLLDERLDIALSFTKNPSEFETQSLESELNKNFPEIKKIKFISSEEAFERFTKNFTSNSQLATWLKKNTKESPLPATLVISADTEFHKEILQFLKKYHLSNILNLNDPATGKLASTTAEKILTFNKALSNISLFSAVSFAVLSVLIIVAVLRLVILSRKTELGIMRLVGATKNFIRLPFILEGIFFAVMASILGATIFYSLLNKISLKTFSDGIYGGFGELLELASVEYIKSFYLTLSWQMLVAIIIGTLASLIATRRYLKREIVLN